MENLDDFRTDFLDNKYTKWYFNIVKKFKNTENKTDSELHHILPKCIYPQFSDLRKNSWNGVYLPIRVHFICHLFLIKMVDNKKKYQMIKAVSMFSMNKTGLRIFRSIGWHGDNCKLRQNNG